MITPQRFACGEGGDFIELSSFQGVVSLELVKGVNRSNVPWDGTHEIHGLLTHSNADGKVRWIPYRVIRELYQLAHIPPSEYCSAAERLLPFESEYYRVHPGHFAYSVTLKKNRTENSSGSVNAVFESTSSSHFVVASVPRSRLPVFL